MEEANDTIFFSPKEEKLNIITHGGGAVLSIIALTTLIWQASGYGDNLHIISFSIFGASLTLAYTASTLFHCAKTPKLRKRLNIFDHSAIYVLIAGTYTPFSLITLQGTTGWTLFGIVWGLALLGIIMKLLFIGKYRILSTLSYVFMGWMIIFVIEPLIKNLPLDGLLWLLFGGISYTIGAYLYSNRRIKFNHALFHIFVLAGSFCHFMSIFLYVR